MNRMLMALILCSAMAGATAAYNVQIGLFNINGYAPVPNATVRFGNATELWETVQTDSAGYAQAQVNDTVLVYNVTRIGFYPVNSQVNISADYSAISVMTPISSDGIVRLTGTDMTGQNRRIRVYFSENSRLQGVYWLNETITLLVNRQYVIVPESTGFVDVFSSPGNIARNGSIYILFFGGVVVIAGIAAFFIGLMLLIIRRIKG